jgi:transposase
VTAHRAAAVEAYERVRRGETVWRVARDLGVSPMTVSRWREELRVPEDAPELPEGIGFDDDGLSAWEREQAPKRLQELRAVVGELLQALRDKGVGAVERRRRAFEDTVAALRGEQAEDDVVSNGMDEAVKRQAVARILGGESVRTLAGELGVSMSTMYAWRERYAADVADEDPDDEGEDEAQQDDDDGAVYSLTPEAWRQQLAEVEAQRDAAERVVAKMRAELAELSSALDQERQEHGATQALHDDLRLVADDLRSRLEAARLAEDLSPRGPGAAARAELEAEIFELKDDLIEAYREQRRLRRALEARS